MGAPFWLIESRTGEMVLGGFLSFYRSNALPPRGSQKRAVVLDLLAVHLSFEKLVFKASEIGISWTKVRILRPWNR